MTPDDAIRMCSELIEANTSFTDWWTRDTLKGIRDQIRETGKVSDHQRTVIEHWWDRHGLLKGGA